MAPLSQDVWKEEGREDPPAGRAPEGLSSNELLSEDGFKDIKADVEHAFQNKDIPMPGDMIQFQVQGFQHWGIYVGDGDVVHFVWPAVSFFPLEYKVRKGQVKGVSLAIASAVYNKFNKDHSPLPPEHVVKRAEHMVGKIMKYDAGRANCEHFATLMRYNVAI